MAVVTKKVRNFDLFEPAHKLYIFVLPLIQIPMVDVARSPAIKRNKFVRTGSRCICVAYIFY
ncbi:hypothetical protein BGW80DRAFT_1293155 [Lactifluus volemus]|nr:hypothetical protein BGW80DRAFT_1293155 [Lactifluus volemus]